MIYIGESILTVVFTQIRINQVLNKEKYYVQTSNINSI